MNQKQRVIDYMNDFGSITSFEAFQDLGITRLSAVIFDLREQGYKIRTKDETSRNRYGEKTTYARYSFEPGQMELF